MLIEPISETQVRLTWPSTDGAYVMEQTVTTSRPLDWNPAVNIQLSADGSSLIVVNAGGVENLYRLRFEQEDWIVVLSASATSVPIRITVPGGIASAVAPMVNPLDLPSNGFLALANGSPAYVGEISLDEIISLYFTPDAGSNHAYSSS